MVYRFWQEEPCNWCGTPTLYRCDVCGKFICVGSHSTTVQASPNMKLHLCPDHKGLGKEAIKHTRDRNIL
ncbi:MAG: hypothetical protein KJ709_04260 [Nanoarchaeota archaeon]|nr:hypothetical protein [Nanoarchaeota archaeon]